MASRVNIKTTFEPAKTLEPIYTGGDVSLDKPGRILASCVEEDVLLVDLDSGSPLARIDGDGESVTSLSLSPLSSHLVICSRSQAMRIYDLSHDDTSAISVRLQRTLKPHNSPVVVSVFDETGSLRATGGSDGSVKVWDIRGGYVTHTFHGHSGVVSALVFFQDDLSVGGSKPSKKARGKIAQDHDHEMTNGFSTIWLASGGEDGKIRIWDLNKRKSSAILDSHVSIVRSLEYSSPEKTLLSASRDKTVIFWDSQSWKARRTIPVLEEVESAGFALEGKCCYTGGANGVVRIWESVTGKEITSEQKAGGDNDAIVAIKQCPKQEYLLSVHQDQTLRLLSLKILQELQLGSKIDSLPVIRRISGNHDEIIDLAYVGPQRSMLALATNTESVRIVSTGSEQQHFGSDIALLEGHEDIIICLDVDWSGYWLATGAKDNAARLWRLDPCTSSYNCFATFVGHAESLGAIALPRTAPATTSSAYNEPFSHPPAFLLTGSQDRTIKRWDTSKFASPSPAAQAQTNARALYTRVAHEKDINALDVSSTSSLFASASQDRTIKIWSLDDGSVVGILRGHKRGVWSIRFAPSNTPPINLSEGGTSGSRGLIASGSGDRTVKVWSLSSYTCLLTFEGHSNSVLKVVWLTPPPVNDDDNGSSRTNHQPHPIIASASADTLIKLWSPFSPANSDHLLATLDNHSDRVWALASHPSAPFPLVSGAADATVTCWRDITSQTAAEATKRASERTEQDQELQNHIYAKNYREVITLALQLNHPGRLLRLFEDVVSKPDKEEGSITGVLAVDEVLGSLSYEQLYLLLQRIRDWNTNASTAPVVQKVLRCLLKSYPASTFVDMARSRRVGGGMKDLLRALEVYTERHYKRMEELVDESFLIDYTLREMEEVGGSGSINGYMDGDVIII